MPSPDPNPGNYVAGLLIFTFSIGTMAASIRKWEEVRKERILRYVPHWDDLELSLSLSVAGVSTQIRVGIDISKLDFSRFGEVH